MKKIFFPLLFLVILAAIVLGSTKALNVLKKKYPLFLMNNAIVKDKEQDVIAIYDPQGKIPSRPKHYRLQIKADSDWKLQENKLKKVALDQPVLLTVEIWGARALDSISAGTYDKKIDKILAPLANRQNLLLRFNPEMEIPNSKTPWANWGEYYVRAFQKFSELTNKILPEAEVVWAPAGALGNMEYYPNQDFFEVASISLGKQDETDLFLKDQSISEVLERKLHRMRFVNVPLLVLGPNEPSAEIEQDMFIEVFKDYEKVRNATNLKDLQTEQEARPEVSPRIGIYDPEEILVENHAVSMEHIFIGLDDIQDGSFEKQFSEITSRGHDLIITVEPEILTDSPVEPNILRGIIAGNYDHLLERFYEIISKEGPVTYLRFAHEMEIPVDRYPWQQQDPVLYIKAFRYFMQFPGSGTKHVKRVWAPAGDRGSVDWWPGSDVVDYISMSIYGLPDKNITDFNLQDSFGEIYTRKKRRLDLFGKPFLIAEYGVKGDKDYQKRWMLEAAEVIKRNREIFGVSYFNHQDVPKAWGEIEPPDWRVSPSTFQEFTEALTE